MDAKISNDSFSESKEGETLTSLGLVTLLSHNDVSRLLVLSSKIVVDDALGASSVSRLGVQGCARVMGHHAVAGAEGVLHRAPDVVFGCGLHVPYVTGVAVDMAGLESGSNGILVDDGTTGGVNDPCTLLEGLEEFLVDEALCTFVEGAVHGDDVALGYELLQILNSAGIDALGGLLGKRCVVVVKKLFALEGLQTLEDTVADTARTDGTNNLALKIVRVASDI